MKMNASKRIGLIICAFALVLVAAFVISFRNFGGSPAAFIEHLRYLGKTPDSFLKSLPTGPGPYLLDTALASDVRNAVVKARDESAIINGVNFLWNIRSVDSTIEPFLDSYCNSSPLWAVKETYRSLRQVEEPSGKEGTR
jgi:hypothetical protein